MLLILVLLLFSLGYAWLLPPIKNWLITCCLVIAVMMVTGMANWLFALCLLLVFAVVTLGLFYLPDMRRNYVSARLFAYVKEIMPPISQTEREAISAGTVWWDAQLFSGNPDWNVLMKVEAPKLSDAEHEFVQGPVQTLCEQTSDWEITHTLNDLSEENWKFIRDNRFFGMNADPQFGGLGFSAHAQSTVLQILASRSASVAVTVMVPNSLGPAELLYHYGTEQQKNHYLPRLSSGEEIPCFALTSPWAGSDADGMPDYGFVCKQEFEGRQVLGFRVSWEKRYITLGPVATLLGLAFKAFDPDHLLGGETELGITCALVPTSTAGVEIGKRHLPLNAAFQNGPNYGKDVFIPMDWVIGGEEMVGQGWRMLMESLSAGRGISLPAAAAGTAKLATRTSSAYVRIREQFGIEIGKFEGVQEALARITGLTYLLDSGRSVMTAALGEGHKPAILSAIVKQQCTDLSRIVVNDAMDLHGGKGICMGPSNYLARTYQQIPIGITVEGANILTRSLIIFGQGMMRCHPFLLEEMEAVSMQDEADGLDRFDAALAGHIGHIMSNKMRAFGYGLTRGWLARGTGTGAVLRYSRVIEHLSASLAYIADVTIFILGGNLKRREMISGRFADALANLYLASSAIKVYRDNGSSTRETPVLEWACEYALFQAQEALNGILKNYPVRMLGFALRLAVFPSGRYIGKPTDRLSVAVSEMIQSSSQVRDRLTREVYQPKDPEDIIAVLEQAFIMTEKTSDLRKRLKKEEAIQAGESHAQWLERLKATDVITTQEYETLVQTRDLVSRVIGVDSF